MGNISAKSACVWLTVFGWVSIVGTVWAQDAARAVRSYASLDEETLNGVDLSGAADLAPLNFCESPENSGTYVPRLPFEIPESAPFEGVLGAGVTRPEAAEDSRTGPATSSLYAATDPRYAFYAGYDNGMFLKGQKDNDSFELKANFRSQFRFVSFSRNEDTWTDNSGIARPIEDRRNLEVSRARIVFSGHALTPQCRFFMQMDGNTDNGAVVSLIDAWAAWHFSDAFEIQVGQRKVAAGRNWLMGAFDTRLADRAFSNEFFRPSRTTGVWFVGDPTAHTHYELMVGQGFNTQGLTPFETGDNFAVGGSGWWDVVGDYGAARPGDFEIHNDPAVRIGTSWVSAVAGTPGRQSVEADFFRLTDGTRLTEPGALVPGATVESFDVTLMAIDAAFKYRGWSANGEYFWRSATDLKANLPVPEVGLQHGFYVEGGFFVLPQQFELNSQFAYVTGRQKTTSSYTTGFSYYPRKSQNFKWTIDATLIDGSPVNSNGSDVLVGDDGVLLRAQWQVIF